MAKDDPTSGYFKGSAHLRWTDPNDMVIIGTPLERIAAALEKIAAQMEREQAKRRKGDSNEG